MWATLIHPIIMNFLHILGVGTCVGGALFADITRVTTVEERTGVFSMFMACRMFGLVVGK